MMCVMPFSRYSQVDSRSRASGAGAPLAAPPPPFEAAALVRAMLRVAVAVASAANVGRLGTCGSSSSYGGGTGTDRELKWQRNHREDFQMRVKLHIESCGGCRESTEERSSRIASQLHATTLGAILSLLLSLLLVLSAACTVVLYSGSRADSRWRATLLW